MKLIIDIPKNFEKHFYIDRFEVSFHRLFADVHSVAGLYERELVVMLIESFKKAKAIDDATMNELTKARWIPCSERLPDKDGEYLASFENDPIGIIPFNVATHSFGFWDESFDDVGIVVSCNWFGIEPIAWMPLPEPYGGDSK